ncbi:MAG: CHAT domain-containing tetratricopeptide repeat protein [Balneolaceae bacterium]|nr:CHAT domain-containing tetratricopeptide repeat protein [Balneolaceae bacterium]
MFLFPVLLCGQSSSNPESLYERAVEIYLEGDYEESKELLTRLIEENCPNTELPEICISGKIYLSDIARRNRDFESSENLIEQADSFFSEYLTSPHPLEARIYVQKVFLYVDMTKFEDARQAADEALKLAEVDGITGIPAGRSYIANAHLEDALGNFQRAFDFYVKAVESVEDLEGTQEILRLLTQAYNNMGILLRRMGKGREAMSYYNKALEVTKSQFGEDHPEMGLLYNNIGGIYYGLGDYGQAADYFLRAANIFRENYGEYHARVAGGYNNAGVAYLQMDDYENGAEMLERAQRIKEQVLGEDHLDTAIGYSNLAYIYIENKEYDSALVNYKKSLSVRERIYGQDHPNLIVPLVSIGEFYTEIKDFSLAREHLAEALRIAEDRLGINHPDVWEITIKLGDTYEKEGNFKQARENFELALKRIVESNNVQPTPDMDVGKLSHPLIFMSAVKKVGDMNILEFENDGELNHLYSAVDYYSTAMKVVDFLQHSYQSESSKLNLIDQNYSIFTNAIKVYHHLYVETGDEAWLDEILRTSELSRSRIALELLQDMEAKAFAGVPDDVLAEEQSINTKIADYYQQLHTEQEKGFEAGEDIISVYRDSLFIARQNLVKLTDELEQNYPDYYQLKYDQSFADRNTVSSLLSDDETLVNYVVSDKQVYALVLDTDNISLHTLGSPDSLSSEIKTLREAVLSNNREQYSALAYKLFNQLIDPVMPSIRTQSLIIVPDQALHYLPFEMLLAERPNGANYFRMPYLIRDFEISYMPSATVLQMLDEQKKENPRNLFAVAPFNETMTQVREQVGSPRYISDLTPLPLTRYETREIAKIFEESRSIWNFFSPEKTDILLGRDATKSAIEQTSFDEYGFIHFATHAFVNGEDPALSGIAFWGDSGEDGVIYVNDIYNMNLNADLVTLGACETGLGTVYKGEGIIGFTRAFNYAGAANLLVSMWRVNDQPTANLMIQFYKYAKDGYSYSDSLQMAKMDLINQPEFAAPRNWAAFVLQGR